MARGIFLVVLGVAALLIPGSHAATRQSSARAAPPTITSSSPILGSVGATVKVLGSGLRDTSRAVFAGNAAAVIVSKAAGEVDVVVPAGARNGNLTLSTPGGTASILFRVVPKVSGVSADSHTVGSAVTISGSGLADVTSVEIDLAQASFHVVSPSEISATIPATAYPTGNIRVTAAGGQYAGPNTFFVRPTINGFSPTSAAAGATIRISGTGFWNPVVRFAGGQSGHVTDWTRTAIKVVVPATAHSGPLTVTTNGGTTTSTGGFTVP